MSEGEREQKDVRASESENEDGGNEGGSPLRWVYLFGIGFNALAFAYALSIGELLYAVTFVVIMVYLLFRYRMFAGR